MFKRTLHMCVTGIGNMEPKFSGTRHNVGNIMVRMIQEQICHEKQFQPVPGFKGIQYVSMRDPTHPDNIITLLICTGGYMNQIGKLVVPLWRRLTSKDPKIKIVVAHDELDRPLGHVQLRSPGTSSRGHNGLKSLTACYGPTFYKLGVGIDRPISRSQGEVAEYVLSKFPSSSLDVLREVTLSKALDKLSSLSH